jgi:hypothetical protein
VLLAVAIACTSETVTVTAPPSGGGSSSPSAEPLAIPAIRPGGAATAAGAIRSLCEPVDVPELAPASADEVPEEIAAVMDQVEQVRGLTFERAPVAEAIDDQEMDRRLAENFETYYPEEPYARRTFAWRTIGVLPPDGDLREALRSYQEGQVIGFYDPATGELVYLGEGDIGLEERYVLAHELTHALDDQHFDLTRLDDLAVACHDEAFEAALGAVEGSAQYFATEVLLEFPEIDLSDLGDLADALTSALGESQGPSDVPPFVQELQLWPYLAGQAFMTERSMQGDDAAVDQALTTLPATTEQVLHPDRYPSDHPTEVDIPDLSQALGPRWGDLDAMEVGEAWLAAMLHLRLDDATSDDAAEGWDGGVYRAWSDGEDVVVVLRTAWDSPADADAFATALRSWIDGSEGSAEGLRDGDQVLLVAATDPALLDDAIDELDAPTI